MGSPVPFNESINYLASAARIATFNGDQRTNYVHKGILFLLDITVVSGTTPTLNLKLQYEDRTAGKWVDVPGAAFAQKTTTGQDSLLVYPGVAETANESVSDVLPFSWRLVGTITGTTPSFTHSVNAHLLM